MSQFAVRGSKEDPALVLLRSGARPTDTTEFVEIAAQKGFAGVLAYVSDADPSLVLHMRAEHHPLHLAIGDGHRDVFLILLDRMELLAYAERDEILKEALYVALNSFDAGEDPTIVYDLLNTGAVPITTRALALAASRCEPRLVSVFLAAGADLRRREDLGWKAASVAQHAAWFCFTKDENAARSIFGALKSAGANVCDVDLSDDRIPEAARTYLRDVEECY